MDQNFDNTPGQEQGADNQHTYAGQETNRQYTDPNAGYQYNDQSQGGYYDSNATGQNKDPYQHGYSYSSYGQNGNAGYPQQPYGGMDTSPMSMGDWVLTILAQMIPCAGIILYFIWAFGKNGNVNRRNFCRAFLIIEAVMIVLAIMLTVVFGVSFYSAYSY